MGFPAERTSTSAVALLLVIGLPAERTMTAAVAAELVMVTGVVAPVDTPQTATVWQAHCSLAEVNTPGFSDVTPVRLARSAVLMDAPLEPPPAWLCRLV